MKSYRMPGRVLILCLCLLALLPFALSPPTPHNVAGFIFYPNGTGVENNFPVLINDTTENTYTKTAVFAPPIPQLAGAYSGTIVGNDGDSITIYSWNATHYGFSSGILASTTRINATLNTTRQPEPNVTIISPPDNTALNVSIPFNVSVNITVLGADGNCNATIVFGNTSVLNISGGDTFTHTLGTINRGVTITTNFTVESLDLGTSSITAYAICNSSEQTLEADTSYTLNNITIIDDFPPIITLITPLNNSLENSSSMINLTYNVSDFSSIINCSLLINNVLSETDITITKNTNQSFLASFPNGQNNWSVECYDSFGNLGISTEFNLTVELPDIIINTTNIWFSNEERVEGTNITIFANITNIGLSDISGSFNVQFFKGTPSLGQQINGNITITGLNVDEISTVNVSYILETGINQVFLIVDSEQVINESTELNNNASNNITVEAYQYYYGNVTSNVTLDISSNETFYEFITGSSPGGHIFVADADSVFGFSELLALTRNTSDVITTNDFSDVDTGLNTSSFNDSVINVWGNGTNTPQQTTTIRLSTGDVFNVPYANSTNTSSFITGILWDTHDDIGNDGEYDTTDKEDLVFVTLINSSQQGKYGVYDYEIKVPARLGPYNGTIDAVSLYYEIE